MTAIISSSSQYYNLLEFIYQGFVKPEKIILIYFKSKNEFSGNFNYFNNEKFKKIYLINLPINNSFLSKIYWSINLINHLFKHLIRIDRGLVSGQIWSKYHSAFAFLTSKKNVYSLDDGNANVFAFTDGKSPYANFIKDKINHFSLMNLPFKNLITNKLSFLKIKSNNIKFNKNQYLIVGSPFISDNYLSKITYNNKILSLINKFPINTEFYYLPHRREKIKDIADIKNLKIINSKGCFELWLLTSTDLPSNFISFGSGLTIALESLFGAKINQYLTNFDKEDFYCLESYSVTQSDVHQYYIETIKNLKIL